MTQYPHDVMQFWNQFPHLKKPKVSSMGDICLYIFKDLEDHTILYLHLNGKRIDYLKDADLNAVFARLSDDTLFSTLTTI